MKYFAIIADMTNLLSLNAAIESARAGEIINHSREQGELVNTIIRRIEIMTSTSVEISKNLESLIHLSGRLETRSREMQAVLER